MTHPAKLSYFSKTPLITSFISRLKLIYSDLQISEKKIGHIKEIDSDDILLLDIRMAFDMEGLINCGSANINPIVLISNDAYLRQVLMHQSSKIILKDFTDQELKIVIDKSLNLIQPEHAKSNNSHFTVHKSKCSLSLTEREIELITNLSAGFLYKEIADQLGISIGTVKQHCHKIYTKLNVSNRTEAVNKLAFK